MKYFWITICALVLFLGGFVWYKYFFVFGEGVKSGVLNYAVRKGNVFKTYEGKLIQEGFGRGKTGGLTSYEFEFSIENEEVFKQLNSIVVKLSICTIKNIMVHCRGAETQLMWWIRC